MTGDRTDPGGAPQRGGASRFVSLAAWRVVLVSPQTAENVGAAARIMRNFGAAELVVVEPRCEIDLHGKAGHMARHAHDVLAARREVATLEEALADVHFSVALTMQASEDRPREYEGLCPRPLLAGRATGERRALVFGREDRGMTNEECSFCSARWSFPTNPQTPSLNLAQAVAVALAGIAQAEAGAPPAPGHEQPLTDAATQEEIEGLIAHAGQVMRASDYERGVPIEYSLRLLRRLALRARIQRSEVRVLRGVCRRLLNALLGYRRRP